MAGARAGYALALTLLAATVAAAAQAPTNQNPPLKPSTEQPQTFVSKTQTLEQSTVPEPSVLVPPAPLVVKREESLISIPVDISPLPRMERTPSAPRAGAGVIVSLPKMEGVVSAPLPRIEGRIEGMISVPALEQRYEQRPATASSTGVKIGSVFGYRRDPFTRRARFHSGVDIKAKTGDPVGSSQSGIIQFAGWYHGYGNLVIVDHGGGVTTYYAHLSSFQLGLGDRVERGTVVGYAGSTGRATSPHLHYELRIDGNAINPFQQVALDPSSAYFKSRPAIDPSGSAPASPVKTEPIVD
jgi:murein DD-endopeptidase MepM/ murein hydrolase activator NlpD